MLNFSIEQWGGLNLADEPEKILLRSHQFAQNKGWVQAAPVECNSCKNIDFSGDGISKRSGSTLSADFSSLFQSGESIINATSYEVSTGGAVDIVVTNKSIYVGQSNVFSKIQNSSSSDYSHNDDVTKCSFAVADGHLFIGLDGNNKIQVYRAGNELDDELNNSNTYKDAFGAGTNTIDGTWGVGEYLLSSFQGRLIYSDGNTVVNYSSIPTATDGIWKRSAHGFYQASGRIVALKAFTPDYQDSIQETLYIFTKNGPQITNDLSSQIQTIEGGPIPINYKSIVATKSWLMMLTENRKIVAMNRNVYIDVGRRFNKGDGTSSVERFNLSSALLKSFGYYNSSKEQVYFFVPTSSGGNNKEAFVLDLTLGEPIISEPSDVYERRIRLAIWDIINPSSNDFYASMSFSGDEEYGFAYDGKKYLFSSGRNDYASLAINAEYETLSFRAGASDFKKMFKLLNVRGRFLSKFNVAISYKVDDESNEASVSYANSDIASLYGVAIYGVNLYQRDVIIRGKDRIHLKGETFSLKIANSVLDQTFIFRSINIDYTLLSREL